ncbi:hypothetical protein MBLNU459_g2697t1 [Dothideomycetes sp. NU459]
MENTSTESVPRDGSSIPNNVLDDASVAAKVEDKTLPDAIPRDQGAVATNTASAAAQLQEVTDRALRFLSHASNETLGACLVGLSATTYFVLGRVGLVLIGVVGGIALHATWEASAYGQGGKDAAHQAESKKRKELGLEVTRRVFAWRDESKAGGGDADDSPTQIVKSATDKRLDFSSLQPRTAAALNTFTDAVIRDYVKWWYAPVLPGEESFPLACRQVLAAFLLSLSSHLSRKRPVDAFLDFVTNSSSIVIVFLNELSAALNASPHSSAPDAVATYLELKPDCSLAHIIHREHQEKKLNLVASDILQNYVDQKAYACAPVQVFLKQILSKLVLSMTIDTCSKPEWINGMIVSMLEDGEPAIMDAMDAGVDAGVGSPSNSDVKASPPQGVALDDKPALSPEEEEKNRRHKRQVSRAEEAMDDAMKEAQRLTQLIAEEEARKDRERQTALSSNEDISDGNTHGIATPSSSQSDLARSDELDPRRTSETPSITKPKSPQALESTTPAPATKQFTSFDQILPAHGPTALSEEPPRLQPKPVLTLFNAKISIFDDSTPNDKANIKFKPTVDYMIQIEPASSSFPGWMIARKYPDFETLHEVLRRISVITGTGFSETHPTLPLWRTNTKASLRDELERYLSDALHFQALAESEGMKRFLEKEQGLARSPGNNKGFGWPAPVAFDQMGKSMIDVLTKAPKEVAGGGQAIFGGVKNVFSGKRAPSISAIPAANRSSISVAPPAAFMEDSYMGNVVYDRKSQDSVRSVQTPISRSASLAKRAPSDRKSRPSLSSRSSAQGKLSGEISRSSSIAQLHSPIAFIDEKMDLPPLPTDIPDDYASPKHVTQQPEKIIEDMTYSAGSGDFVPQPLRRVASSTGKPPETPSRPTLEPEKTAGKTRAKPPITEQETQVAVELLFAVITELYTLSSAWNIRRTLLNAAKTFLLRPGNPQLEAIRILIQETVIDTNTSDAGIAAQILKVRENSLPTEEEMKKWPAPLNDKEKEDLRIKARRLLVERGMPQALTSVMGAAASGEALGKVFDCLQVESVARGLIFGLMLQGLRAIVQ